MDDLQKPKRMHRFLIALKNTSQWIWGKIRKPTLFVGYILGKILAKIEMMGSQND